MLSNIREAIENQQTLVELDRQLVNAAFLPAVKAGMFESNDLSWQDPTCKRPGDALLDQLLRLSEFYQARNVPLSSAIWGVWNTAKYLRLQKGVFALLFERKRTSAKFFVGLHALVATAALQFADGNATTVVTSDAADNLAAYRQHVDRAIALLAAVPTS